jgi:predicted O-methyltransferase YrrM/catechol 2,3-dioxygenase-like lactoylglutathione lyase family enzyme
MGMFNKNIEEVLAAYHARIEEENMRMQSLTMEQGMRLRDEFLLSVGEETAQFIHSLAKASKATCILELGTSYGYSTIWLAEAAKANGGKIISLENIPEKAKYAQEQIDKAGLTDVVEIRLGDALETLKNSIETFDFVLVDLWKELYLPCFELFFPKLKLGAYIVADNMIFPPHSQKEANLYRNRIEEIQAFDTVLMPIGSGIEVSRFIHLNNPSITLRQITNYQLKPHHVGISIGKMAESIAWYEKHLGFKLVVQSDFPAIKSKITFLRNGDFQIELFEHYESQKIADFRKNPLTDMQYQGTLHICFYVENGIEQMYNQLVENGVEVAMSLRLSPPGDALMCFIRDNTGNLIEILEKKK